MLSDTEPVALVVAGSYDVETARAELNSLRREHEHRARMLLRLRPARRDAARARALRAVPVHLAVDVRWEFDLADRLQRGRARARTAATLFRLSAPRDRRRRASPIRAAAADGEDAEGEPPPSHVAGAFLGHVAEQMVRCVCASIPGVEQLGAPSCTEILAGPEALLQLLRSALDGAEVGQ
jgi:hypothetical protein